MKIVVLPRIQWSTDSAWHDFIGWMNELRSVGVFLTPALPYVLLHRPSEASRFSNLIAQDLDSDAEDAVRSAAMAIRDWTHLQHEKGIPKIEMSAVNNLIRRVVFRRKKDIEVCLWALGHIMFERPEVFTQDQIDLLVASLGSWQTSTELPMPSDTSDGFSEGKRPMLRRLVGELIIPLKLWLQKAGQSPSTASHLAVWQAMCATDPLPEVRRSLERWGEFHN